MRSTCQTKESTNYTSLERKNISSKEITTMPTYEYGRVSNNSQPKVAYTRALLAVIPTEIGGYRRYIFPCLCCEPLVYELQTKKRGRLLTWLLSPLYFQTQIFIIIQRFFPINILQSSNQTSPQSRYNTLTDTEDKHKTYTNNTSHSWKGVWVSASS